MIKSNISGPDKKESYPTLKAYQRPDCFYVVLFTKPRAGVVVYSESEYNPVGMYMDGSASASWAEDSFKPYFGKISLENG